VRSLAAAIFNYTVGSGIFALPALAVARLGTSAPLAYLVCAVIMALVVLCFAEAGSRVAATGGPYAYVEVALGPLWGLLAGVLLFLTGLSAGAAVAVLFARSLSSLATGAPTWLPATLIVAVIATLAVVNVRGVRRGARFVELVTLAKLVPLVAFVVFGAAFVDPRNLTWHGTPAVSSVLGTAGVVIFAFSGIESALTPSGEVREPERTVPRASFLALGAATALYLAIQWVALGIMGVGLAASETTPLADAAGTFAGPAGRIAIILGASVSMLGYLSGNVLAVPRSLFALARDGFLPASLSSVHARYRTPHVAIVLYALGIGALALTGTFEHLAIFANLTACVLYILCAVGVLVLRRRDVRASGKPFVVPGGPLVPLAACVVNAWLIYETVGPADVRGLALAIAAALLLYLARSSRRARPDFP
jgi:amino acid transporter